ncbi:MAG TPA: biopolymer transporter ExbD [Polyangiaceae bacterium]
MASVAQDSDEEITGINVTPLVDVVLVLLVVLMVTAGFIASQAIPVELPNAATGESVPETLTISVDAAGATYVDGRKVGDSELRPSIALARKTRPNLRAVIAADGRAAHRHVVRVVDTLRQEHLTEFALDVRPEDVARSP